MASQPHHEQNSIFENPFPVTIQNASPRPIMAELPPYGNPPRFAPRDVWPRLTVYCGPMFAGKTLALVRAHNLVPPDDRIAIKPRMDTRYSADSIIAHSGESIPAIAMDNLQGIEKIVGRKTSVFIDEGQFFMDLAEKCNALLALGKDVYIAGLTATAQQRPWPSMSEVMAIADDIVHIKAAECQTCRLHTASHTFLRSDILTTARGKSMPTIKIGGSDLYVAVCRNCLAAF